MSKTLIRGLGLGALALGLMTNPISAQNGSNYHVLSNGGDTVYFGIGAGTAQVSGVDGVGYFSPGEDMVGTSMSTLTGNWAYKQSGFRMAVCNFQPGATRLHFPRIAILELDNDSGANGEAGTNPALPLLDNQDGTWPNTGGMMPRGISTDPFNHNFPFNFIRPGCITSIPATKATAPSAIGSTGPFGLNVGSPPGTSFQFIVAPLPSAGTLPSSVSAVFPNNGITPSSTGGTVAVVIQTSAAFGISATGCFLPDIDWVPTALPALNTIDGWWTWLTNSADNNQYWVFSNDNMNATSSYTELSLGGIAGVFGGIPGSDLEVYNKTQQPATNAALHPAGHSGVGPYYLAHSTGGMMSNPGFDVGIHRAVSTSGLGGSANTFFGLSPGLGWQDPANTPVLKNDGATPIDVRLGFATWNNKAYSSAPGMRAVWMQIEFDYTNGPLWGAITANTGGGDPDAQNSVTIFFGLVRVPITINRSNPGAWPQSITIKFLPVWLHSTADQTGNTLLPDPSGAPAGAGGHIPHMGHTGQGVALGGVGTVCNFTGLPIGLSYGSTGLTSGGGLNWNPDINQAGNGRQLQLID